MASYSDDFNRANSTTMGGSWVEDSGDFQILSNGVMQDTSGGAYRKCRWNAAFDTGDYYAQADVTIRDTTGNGFGVFIRGASSSTVTMYGYVFFQGDVSYILEITAGVDASLATGGSVGNAGTGYTAARLAGSGTGLTGTRNSVADISTSDGTLTAGHAGLVTYGISASAVCFDNYAAADTGAVATRIRDMIGLDILPKRR